MVTGPAAVLLLLHQWGQLLGREACDQVCVVKCTQHIYPIFLLLLLEVLAQVPPSPQVLLPNLHTTSDTILKVLGTQVKKQKSPNWAIQALQWLI